MANKSDNKKGKSSSVVKAIVKSDASETVNPDFISEEEIRELAEILYHQRIDRGVSGSDLDDWFRAENYLRQQENN